MFADVALRNASIASRAVWALAAWLLAAVLIGLIFDRVGIALAVVLGCYALSHLYRLIRMESWLRRAGTAVTPDYDGLWGEVLAMVSALERRKEFHKQRNVLMLREFRRLTTAMPDGAVLLNTDNEILWFNRHAGERLQLRRKRDFGMRIENLVRHPTFIDYLQSGEFSEAVTFQTPGRSNQWLSLYLVTSRDAPQRLLIVRDVTRQVLLEQMRKDFVANASHELRSPLTVVSGYLDSLGDEESLSPAWRQPVAEMRRQTERMRTLIDHLLELSALEQRSEGPAAEFVDVAGMLSMLRKDALSLEIRPHIVDLKLDSKAGLRGAERELHSIFANLIDNAMKYTPQEGEVHIRWWTDAQGGHLSVADRGIGIASEHLPRLTERFYRVDAGRSREMGGSGLGLAIVKHALQRHEGRLEVQSEVGKGSVFTCHFPPHRVQ